MEPRDRTQEAARAHWREGKGVKNRKSATQITSCETVTLSLISNHPSGFFG
jgi:hypothetical protein